ncbi:14822_t:CDS:2 [Funneliformis geosporum]|uniref:13922_t:CDS:1 n=1 Tax=Funneliformis geosporum TaxID=1117311 RepID=A0A9W4WTQ0_9GLOM|nr:13922_t:CDS:2 [Funneliformis geosporum]CAI2180075.1 14822_t:CDS:2 [Funneliformis geosporum]
MENHNQTLLNHGNINSLPPTSIKTSEVINKGSAPNSPSTRSTVVPSNLNINLPTFNNTIATADTNTTTSNDAVITIVGSNSVTNFLTEKESKNSGSTSVNTTWENIFKNLYYILAWYFFSTALSFYNKNLMGKEYFNLKLPLLISAMHTGMHALVTTILMSGNLPMIYKKTEGKSVSISSYFTRVVPCAVAAALEICMANASLVFITLSFYTMVKSSTPIWVLIFAFAFGLEQPKLILIIIITVISVGVLLTVEGETRFNLTGFLLVLGAAIISGLRWTLTQMLLQKEEGMNNPVATLYYLSPIMFILMSILSLIFEQPFQVFNTSKHFENVTRGLQTFGLMLMGGLLAFCMTIAEFALIKNTSTVTLSVAGISKEVVVITLSVLIYHDELTPINLLGLFISITGIIGYNYYKINKPNSDKKGRYQALPPHKNNSLD